jgi:hypothetical protein
MLSCAPRTIREDPERMRRYLRVLAVVAVMTMAGAGPAAAQFVYLDVNGDGLPGALDPSLPPDVLSPSTVAVDVYLDTTHNADGSAAVCSQEPEPLTIGSYEILLTWTGPGEVVYGGWTNNLPGFAANLTGGPGGVTPGERDIWIGLGASGQIPPGRYRVGTLAVSITGHPILTWVVSSPLSRDAEAAFGTLCDGVDYMNTYVLGKDFVGAIGTSAAPLALGTTWEKIQTLYR